MRNDTIYFAKVNSSKETIMPTKREEDAGFDVYANFEEDYMIIEPHETKMIPTNLASAFSEDYVAILKERGSTGSKGIGQRCGVIDSGYRNEWFVPLTNHNDETIVIVKNNVEYSTEEIKGDNSFLLYGYRMKLKDTNGKDKFIVNEKGFIVYPYEKAITQVVMAVVPKLHTEEVSYEKLLKFESERGMGKLGSSNK